MTPGFGILETARINRIMQALQDVRTLPQQLLFLNRTPVVDAFENEIMANFNGHVQIADLIGDDQEAVTYASGNFTLEATAVPNLKVGYQLSQRDINNIALINQNPSVANDPIWKNWTNGRVDWLRLGIQQRMEALIVAMKLDQATYNRMGIQITSGSWGMPPDLKVFAAVGWANPNSATPVDDSLGVIDLARVRYGIVYDRITMTAAAFRAMIATNEFQTKLKANLPTELSYLNFSLHNLQQQRQFASTVLGVQIELYDARYWTQLESGLIVQAPYLPLGKVILESSANDNNAAAADFGNGIVTESLVAGMLPTSMYGTLGGVQRGPVAYTTVANAQLNPPGVTMWGVARGFPRKFLKQSNAVLDIGTITDTIPTTDPFAPPTPTANPII